MNLRYACPDKGEGIQVSFIAPKRTGTAVQRNRTKRLMREAYRLHQFELTDTMSQLENDVHFAFIARKALNNFDSVENEVVTLLGKLRTRLLSPSEHI